MQRVIVGVMVGIVLLAGFSLETVWGADPKVIQTHKTKDMAVTLLSESGQWTQGKNSSSWSSRRRRPTAGRCGQGHPEHQHADARHGADARGRHAVP